MPCFLANDRDAMFGTSLSRSLCLNTKSKRNTWSALCLFAIAPRMSITSTDIQRTLCNRWMDIIRTPRSNHCRLTFGVIRPRLAFVNSDEVARQTLPSPGKP